MAGGANFQVVDVKGTPTETLSLHPESHSIENPTETSVLVVPGNPGVVHFYRDFLFSVFDKFERRFSVIVGSFLLLFQASCASHENQTLRQDSEPRRT